MMANNLKAQRRRTKRRRATSASLPALVVIPLFQITCLVLVHLVVVLANKVDDVLADSQVALLYPDVVALVDITKTPTSELTVPTLDLSRPRPTFYAATYTACPQHQAEISVNIRNPPVSRIQNVYQQPCPQTIPVRMFNRS